MNTSPLLHINLNAYINYQDGSVVSREVMRIAAGTSTLFAFAEGQGLSEHTTPYDALVIIVDGEAEITVDGKAKTVKQGEFIHMPANHPHALRAHKPFKMLLTMMKA
jgi:quercetin dioxygenase-like cupin family protein